jgi:signal peptidase I
LVAATAALSAAIALPFRPVVVRGNSMAPTLHNNQIAWMARRAPRVENLRRGDVVVFRFQGDTYIKRIVALPGDIITLVQFKTDTLALIERKGPFASSSALIERGVRRSPILGHLTRYCIPRDSLFVMGDDECASVDSRTFGPVRVSSVMGRIHEPTPSADARPDSLAIRARSGTFITARAPKGPLVVTNAPRDASK